MLDEPRDACIAHHSILSTVTTASTRVAKAADRIMCCLEPDREADWVRSGLSSGLALRKDVPASSWMLLPCMLMDEKYTIHGPCASHSALGEHLLFGGDFVGIDSTSHISYMQWVWLRCIGWTLITWSSLRQRSSALLVLQPSSILSSIVRTSVHITAPGFSCQNCSPWLRCMHTHTHTHTHTHRGASLLT